MRHGSAAEAMGPASAALIFLADGFRAQQCCISPVRTRTLSPNLLSPDLGCVFKLMERCCLIASISSLVMAPTVMCVMGMMAA